MGMEYKGLDANTELTLQVVAPKGKEAIYTFTLVDNAISAGDKADYYGEVFIDMSTEEVTRLRDELTFILEHERQHELHNHFDRTTNPVVVFGLNRGEQQ
jgi:uncharacterized protein YfaP (DUF2135 family)